MAELRLNTPGSYRITGTDPLLFAGVTGRASNTTDYEGTTETVRASDKLLLESVTGIGRRKIIMLDQVHGDRILHIDREPDSDILSAGMADGLITASQGICLVIRTADCVPVFLVDPEVPVLGAVHSGWKGTVLNIAGKCLKEMSDRYGADPGRVRAYILPSIGPESYRVNEDVSSLFPDETIRRPDGLYVDLWKSIERALVRGGVKSGNIFNSRICTMLSNSEFFSHRCGDKGRNLNYACLR